MMRNPMDAVQAHIERSLEALTASNNKLLAADIVAIIAHAMQGDHTAAYIGWRWVDSPAKFRALWPVPHTTPKEVVLVTGDNHQHLPEVVREKLDSSWFKELPSGWRVYMVP